MIFSRLVGNLKEIHFQTDACFSYLVGVMSKPDKHKWIFPARFRTGAYSWQASRLACQRLREAVSDRDCGAWCLNVKMTCDIHALMRDANDINSASGDFIEDQVHAFREAIVAGFYIRALFPKLRVF